jgi:hypothetical protein
VKTCILMILLSLPPVLAVAGPTSAPTTPAEAIEAAKQAAKEAKAGNWWYASAGIITLLMYLLKLLGTKVWSYWGALGRWRYVIVPILSIAAALLATFQGGVTVERAMAVFTSSYAMASLEEFVNHGLLGKAHTAIVLCLILPGCNAAQWATTARASLDATSNLAYRAAVRTTKICDVTVKDCMALPAPKTPKGAVEIVGLVVTGLVDLLQIVKELLDPAVDTAVVRRSAVERSEKALALYEALDAVDAADRTQLAGRQCDAWDKCRAARRSIVQASVGVQAVVLAGYVAIDAKDQPKATNVIARVADLIRPITNALSAYGITL